MAASSSAPSEITLDIKSWNPVGYWKFASNTNESCSICQTPLTMKCIECSVDSSKRCGLSHGRCGHIFHVCCIDPWTNREQNLQTPKCPYCFKDWELDKQEFDHC